MDGNGPYQKALLWEQVKGRAHGKDRGLPQHCQTSLSLTLILLPACLWNYRRVVEVLRPQMLLLYTFKGQ